MHFRVPQRDITREYTHATSDRTYLQHRDRRAQQRSMLLAPLLLPASMIVRAPAVSMVAAATAPMLTAERYVATNRFRVKEGREASFEKRWADRSSRLGLLDGFRFFCMMRRVERDGPKASSYEDDINCALEHCSSAYYTTTRRHHPQLLTQARRPQPHPALTLSLAHRPAQQISPAPSGRTRGALTHGSRATRNGASAPTRRDAHGSRCQMPMPMARAALMTRAVCAASRRRTVAAPSGASHRCLSRRR